VWRTAAVAYVVSRVAVLAGVLLSASRSGTSALDAVMVWDGTLYRQLVEHGYPRHVQGESTIVFFPGYSQLARVLDVVVPGDARIALIVLSLVTGLIATGLIGVLFARHAGAAVARRGLILVAVFPGSFVFGFPYSEGTFLVAVAACLLLIEDEHWLAAGVAACAATLCRPTGIALVVPVAIVAIGEVRRRRPQALIVVAMCAAGMAGWFLFLWHHTGVAGAWFRAERDGYGQQLSLYEGAVRPVKAALTFSDLSYVQVSGWGVIAAIIGIALLVRDREGPLLTGYTATSVALSIVASLISARPRALLAAFPLFLPLARRLDGWWFRAWVLVSLVLLGVLSYHYSVGFLPRGPSSMVP
jgi:hypothetical protein